MTQFNDRSTPLSLLLTRRSGKARNMTAPGPSDEDLRTMLRAAMRVPDHGKIAPWRFLIVPERARDAFAATMLAAYDEDKPDAGKLERRAVDDFARQAPALVIVLHKPDPSRSIPLKEQQFSAAAATMQLLNAAHASGYVANWLTGWAVYSDAAHRRIAEAGERILGFVFIGTQAGALEERPRPEFADVVRIWGG